MAGYSYRLTPPTPVQSEHVRAPPPKWQVVLEGLDGEESGEEAESEGDESELAVELSPEVHQHLRKSTSQLLTASRLRWEGWLLCACWSQLVRCALPALLPHAGPCLA